jgi:serine/threonine-protein kinase
MDVPQFIAGRFRIEREIGTGGMGTVYLATHLGLERPVAVKIIKREFASDSDVAERFLREARTMAKLRHPHAAMIFDAGSLPDGRHFIIMELVEGETLSQALTREGRFSPHQAVRIATQVCDVLEEAHRLGIVHRDLKPSNIMLSHRGVCVLDFGVAKVLASTAESTATHASTGSGHLVGTPRYMSPEQCLGQRVGARSDLYSLGVLLYEMLAGRPPFVDPLQSALLVKQATALPPPLPKLRQDIPRPLALAVHSLLAKRPEDRPRTAAAAKSLLERSLVQPERTLPDLEPLSSMVAATSPSRSIAFRVGAPLILVMMFGAFLAWGYTGESASDPAVKRAVSNSFGAGPPQTIPASYNDRPASAPAAKSEAPVAREAFSETLTMERARKIAAGFASGTLGMVQIVDTDSGQAIVAIDNPRKPGNSNFFVLEKRSSKYRITSKGRLDIDGFRRANWSSEVVDADEDGYEEVMFLGKDLQYRLKRHLVLHVPNDNKTYSMVMTGESTPNGTPRIMWLANAAGTDAAAYRTALRKRARTLLVATNKR